MKIRQGFVSNSSSTSFYIDSHRHSLDKVGCILDTLIDAYNLARGENNTISSFCEVSESDKESVKSRIKEFYSYVKGEEYINHLKWIENDFKDFSNKVITIDSIDDNSIPYAIQGFLENALNARRQHWG